MSSSWRITPAMGPSWVTGAASDYQEHLMALEFTRRLIVCAQTFDSLDFLFSAIRQWPMNDRQIEGWQYSTFMVE